MSKPLFLGFDGGATKTTGTAIDEMRNIVAVKTGGPSNFQIIGTDKAAANILSLIEDILRETNSDFASVKGIYLGLTGAGRVADADRMMSAFVAAVQKRGYRSPNVKIGSDAIAALEGAFGGKPGMILISGTGSILFAKDHYGRVHRVGGWGRFIGDEGSGYALGRSCLSAVAREFDGRGQKTSMTVLLKDRNGIDSPESLITEVYRNNLDIASLAPTVIQAASDGDEVASGIASAAAADLVDHIRSALPGLGTQVPIVLGGSILSSDNFISRKVSSILNESFPGMIIRQPQFPPSVGAAFLALKAERSQ